MLEKLLTKHSYSVLPMVPHDMHCDFFFTADIAANASVNEFLHCCRLPPSNDRIEIAREHEADLESIHSSKKNHEKHPLKLFAGYFHVE